MYNNLLLLALLATILPIVDLTDDLLFEIIVPLILLANTNVLVAVYVPKVLRKFKVFISTGSSSTLSVDATKTAPTTNNKSTEMEMSKSNSV
jgi:hypothetical protein